MRRAALFVLLSLGAVPAEAALSGYYDSAEQINMILSNAAIADAVHQAPIDGLTRGKARKDGAFEWIVRTGRCTLKVYLTPVVPDYPGKTTYRVDPPGACK